MYATGRSLNAHSIFGLVLVLGMVVDDAVVVIENCYRYIQKGYHPKKAAVIGTIEVGRPVIASVATTIAAFLPLVLMPGIMGRFMRIIPVVVTLVLAASIFEAFFILPAHIGDWSKKLSCGNNTKKKNTTVQSLKTVIEKKLQLLVQRNPLRTNFQEHYEKIIAEYNKEKDRQSIEATFEALLKFVQELDEEESRAMQEGMDEETLAVYDLLLKADLTPKEIQRIKKIAKELLVLLKEKLKNLYSWQDKEPTRDKVKVLIRNFLWDEKTGLPVDFYSQSDVDKTAEAVFYHVYRAYPTVPSPYYATI